MAIRPPNATELTEIATSLGLHPNPGDIECYQTVISPLLQGLGILDELPDGCPPVRYARTPGERPEPEDNPLGAWFVKSRIEGVGSGPLAGKTFAVKDNVMLAGVPMMNGATTIEGYIPPVDATIVTRILDAGGTILGKAVCESYCFSGGSHTSASGPVRNPHAPAHTAGGSSSGSAALVAAGEVDVAIGCDQGGSIRIPASFCGTFGMKATHGLVPYTGILGMDPTIDHVGPITASVADNALALEVLAGPDGLDSRQYAPRVEAYREALGAGVDGLRIGVLREGFGLEGFDPAVDEKVLEAGRRLERLGAKQSDVSVPVHAHGPSLTFGMIQSMMLSTFETDGCAVGRQDPLVPSFLDFHRGWRQRADELPETVKSVLLLSEYMRRRYGYRYYAKSVNQVRRLRAAYDAVFEQCDLLILPTTPTTAPPLPAPDCTPAESIAAAFAPIANTAAFDYTHHPAMSVPCGAIDGLPVGMMLVGRHFEESTIYRAAHAFEQHEDWRSL